MLKKLYVKPIIVGIIVFFVSLIMDVLMGESVNYGYAFDKSQHSTSWIRFY